MHPSLPWMVMRSSVYTGIAKGIEAAAGAAFEADVDDCVQIHSHPGVVHERRYFEGLQARHPQRRGDQVASGIHEHAAAGQLRSQTPATDTTPVLGDV